MKKQESKEIAVNVSSGAEKVEKIEKQVAQSPQREKKTVKKSVKSVPAQAKAKREKQKEKARVQRALKKKEEKEKKKALRKEKREKILAKRKEKREKALQRRKELEQKRKQALEEKRRRRAHAKANKNQQKARRNSEKRKGERKGKVPSGWLAAVVGLGATSLVLATVVTLGSMDMRKQETGMLSAYRFTTYELASVMENVDDDLDRVRVSASPEQQARILTDVLVQARVAESDLEKLPVDGRASQNLTSFINRVASESERMLSKIRNGERLSKQDVRTLDELYRVCHVVRAELDGCVASMTDDDMKAYLKNAQGNLAGVIERVESATLPENGDPSTGAGMERRKQSPPMGETDASKIDTSKAEDLCAVYFAKYGVKDFQCIGETVAMQYSAYNLQGYDEKGVMLFAEVDSTTGALLRFDYYEDCKEIAFDMENAKDVAENFLDELGYSDMTAVRVRENGTDADFTFVYENDDVVYYPDTVRVKVCRARGLVTGLDATKYALNHKQRKQPQAKLSVEKAKEKLHDGLEVLSSRLAVVETPKGEKTAYEFFCAFGEERYVLYLSAETGKEIAIVNVNNVK